MTARGPDGCAGKRFFERHEESNSCTQTEEQGFGNLALGTFIKISLLRLAVLQISFWCDKVFNELAGIQQHNITPTIEAFACH